MQGKMITLLGEGATLNDAVKNALATADSEKLKPVKTIMFNMNGNPDSISMLDINDAINLIRQAANAETEITWDLEETFDGKVSVRIMARG